MTPESDHIFWAKRWRDAHEMFRVSRNPYIGGLAAMNYTIYLCEVYSWMFEHWRVYRP